MKDVDVMIDESDLQTSDADLGELENSRTHRRVFDLFRKRAEQKLRSSGDKQLHFVFFRAPVALLPSEDGAYVKGVRFEKTRLEGSNPQKVVATGEFEDLDCQLVLKSIGYKSLPVSGLPFDHKQGIVPNCFGRVQSNNSNSDPGLYVAGWLKRGPTGIIGTNDVCADEVVASIEEDMRNLAVNKSKEVAGSAGLESILKERNKRYISFHEWERLDAAEVERGSLKNKPREKIVGVKEALEVAEATS